MLDKLNQLEHDALDSLARVNSAEDLTAWQAKYFGTKRSKGELDQALSVLAA